MSAIANALMRAGFDRSDYALGNAVFQFMKSGGTQARAIDIVRSIYTAEKMPGKDQNFVAADSGPSTPVPPRQPVEDAGGHSPRADNGLISVAPVSSSDRGGEGQARSAVKGQSRIALPVREPSDADRRAARTVRAIIAKTILDRVKTGDGRAWGDVGAHELDWMERDGALARAIKAKIGPLSNKQRFKTLRELITPEQFDAARAEASANAQ